MNENPINIPDATPATETSAKPFVLGSPAIPLPWVRGLVDDLLTALDKGPDWIIDPYHPWFGWWKSLEKPLKAASNHLRESEKRAFNWADAPYAIKPPKLRRDWIGKYVAAKYDLGNGNGRIPRGTVLKVLAGHCGANLETLPCPCCGTRFYITKVDWLALQYLGEDPWKLLDAPEPDKANPAP